MAYRQCGPEPHTTNTTIHTTIFAFGVDLKLLHCTPLCHEQTSTPLSLTALQPTSSSRSSSSITSE
eukprot:3169724-Amphidinium_carterae.3